MKRIFLFDLELSPKISYIWSLFQDRIPTDFLIEDCRIMSFAGKFYGEDKIYYEDARDNNDKKLLKSITKLINYSDIIVAHNGDRFDIPVLKTRLIANKLPPFAPVKSIDTLKLARSNFKFTSNKLEYLAKFLKCNNKKSKHSKFTGIQLWIECLKGNPEAWEEMKHYNIQDVRTLEDVLRRLSIYCKIPNLLTQDEHIGIFNACPKCGSRELQKRGFYATNSYKYQRYQCKSCYSWSKSVSRDKTHNKPLVQSI